MAYGDLASIANKWTNDKIMSHDHPGCAHVRKCTGDQAGRAARWPIMNFQLYRITL